MYNQINIVKSLKIIKYQIIKT